MANTIIEDRGWNYTPNGGGFASHGGGGGGGGVKPQKTGEKKKCWEKKKKNVNFSPLPINQEQHLLYSNSSKGLI